MVNNMYSVSDLKKGLKIEINGAPYVITEFSFSKPGKGHAIYACKLKNLINGTTMTKQYRPTAKIDKPRLKERTLQYSYDDGDSCVFMDENYEQVSISADVLGDSRFFLAEDIEAEVLFHNGRPIDVTLPNFVEKEIIRTDPGARGNTATNVLKPAAIKGGYQIQIPLFVNQGDVVKIDTRTGRYVDRITKKTV